VDESGRTEYANLEENAGKYSGEFTAEEISGRGMIHHALPHSFAQSLLIYSWNVTTITADHGIIQE
jgi:hypothetical protein